VSECDREVSIMRRPFPTKDCCAMEKNYKYVGCVYYTVLKAEEWVRMLRFCERIIGRGRPKYSQKNISHYHNVQHATRIALGSNPGLYSKKPTLVGCRLY
jgi:hypothetical protein